MHASLVSLTRAKTCFPGVVDTGEVGDLYFLVSATPVMHDVTGVVDTELILYRTFYTEFFYTELFIPNLFYIELILYQTHFIPNLFYTELGGGEGTGVARWRGWRSL
jgi:hypothetical protein